MMSLIDVQLHGKGSTDCENSHNTPCIIFSTSGLENFLYINRVLTKLGRYKLGGPLIMEHRVYVGYAVYCCILLFFFLFFFVLLHANKRVHITDVQLPVRCTFRKQNTFSVSTVRRSSGKNSAAKFGRTPLCRHNC